MTTTQRTDLRPSLVLAVLLVFAAVPNIIWIFLNQSVWPWDPAWYGQVSLDLVRSRHSSFQNWIGAMQHAFGFKAPGIAWLGQFFAPLGEILGGYERALLLLIVTTQVISAGIFYKVCCALFRARSSSACTIAAITGTVALCGAPQFIGLSHQYFTEPLQLVAITALLALWVSPLGSLELLLGFIAIASFGLLAKSTTPLYMAVPALGVFYRAWSLRRLPVNWKRTALLLTAALGIGLPTYSWYSSNLSVLADFMIKASSGEYASLYGKDAPFLAALKFWLEQAVLAFFGTRAIAWLWVGCAVAALIIAAYQRFRPLAPGHAAPRHDDRVIIWHLTLASVLQIVLVLCFFATQINRETRYLYPLAPYVALLFACLANWASRLGIAVLLVALVQWVCVHAYALGFAQFAQIQKSQWIIPLDQQVEQRRRLERVLDITCRRSFANRYHIIAVELPSFNANSASFFASQRILSQGLDFACYYTSLGYAERDLEKAWKRLVDMKAATVAIPADYTAAPDDPFNAVTRATMERIRNTPGTAVLDDGSSSGVIIYELPH